MLTDKCKEDFERWFELEYSSSSYWDMWIMDENFPESMKYGVYVDFFQSKDILLDVHPLLDYDENTYTKVLHYMVSVITLNVESLDNSYLDDEFSSLSDARAAVINKANETYNKL